MEATLETEYHHHNHEIYINLHDPRVVSMIHAEDVCFLEEHQSLPSALLTSAETDQIAWLVEEENSKPFKCTSFTDSLLPAATPFTAITNAVFNVLGLAAYVAIVINRL